jgi:hypothetical protein
MRRQRESVGGCSGVIGRSNPGQARHALLGDETATWTRTIATGFLGSLDLAPRFGDFLGFIFKSPPSLFLGLGHVR